MAERLVNVTIMSTESFCVR